ncbi:MAG: hypothetical protein HC896_02175 [Bacteroidales bacterium]|nr:hypothetical protein [Bacteroidales bacterium]
MRPQKLFLNLFTAGLLFTIPMAAQLPQAFNYQAIARDAQNQVLADKPIKVKISLLQGDSKTSIYTEVHDATTNKFGIFNLKIGQGTSQSGAFGQIDWAKGKVFLKLELDVTNAGSYTDAGTTELLSVPFAMYANQSGNAEMDSLDELQDLSLNGNILAITGKSNAAQIDLSGYLDNTDGQLLSLTSNQLSISGGNTLDLNALVNDEDADPTNELQVISVSSDTIFLSNGGFVKLPYTAGAGIELNNNQIVNNAPDKTVTIAGTGGTNVTGTYPNFTVNSTNHDAAIAALQASLLALQAKIKADSAYFEGKLATYDKDSTNEIQRMIVSGAGDTLRLEGHKSFIVINGISASNPNSTWQPGDSWRDTRDGQAYATVQIGSQVWMAQNLNYRNNTGPTDTTSVYYKKTALLTMRRASFTSGRLQTVFARLAGIYQQTQSLRPWKLIWAWAPM